MKIYKHEGIEFEVGDSENGCYLTVAYRESGFAKTGYIGLNLGASNASERFSWTVHQGQVEKNGIRNGNRTGTTLRENLDALCRSIIEWRDKMRAQRAFQEHERESACKEICEFLDDL